MPIAPSPSADEEDGADVSRTEAPTVKEEQRVVLSSVSGDEQ
jgi:hypothetical protein